MPKTTQRTLVIVWLGWFLVLYGFQWLVTSRLGLMRPDLAVPWSRTETMATSNRGKIYLLEPFMNRQVAWDSEYYVGIAVGGYDDPEAGAISSTASGEPVIKNYSFFPFYPYVMTVVRQPLTWLGMGPIAAAVAAGVIVTLLGTLAGIFALWHLTRDLFEEDSAGRAAFYMLIFPTAFFFAMVYTEGLFIGLAFWSLLLSKRRQWLWASLLAMLATWTRAHGAALALPLLWAWVTAFDKADTPAALTAENTKSAEGRGESAAPSVVNSAKVAWHQALPAAVKNGKWWAQGLLALLPLGAYLSWRLSPLGQGWAELQPFYFARGFLSIQRTLSDVRNVYEYAQTTSQAAVYFSIEAAAVALALVASVWLLRRDRPLALFGLAVVLLSVLSGSVQSMARYVLISPPLYIFLAHLGRNKAFDRIWTLASVLLLGMSAMLFAFDMWVG